MTRAIDSENLYKFLTDQRVKERGAYSKGVNTGLDIARSALRNEQITPTLTPPNEPLTLDELREMDGEPAYIPETNCWVLVTKNPFVPLFTWPDGEQCSAYDWYEQVGPVYRRPPEGEDGDANHA